MKKIYLLSGLGADHRVFDYLELSGYHLQHIKWTKPRHKEPIEDYAKRLVSQIQDQNPILLGVSFGGIMAIEIAKLIKVERIILISSVRTQREIPFYYRLIGSLGVNKLMPSFVLKSISPVTYWFFGTMSNSDRQLLKQIIIDTDARFLKWAINIIVNWRNSDQIKELIVIGGSNDRLLPARNPDYLIEDGGHFMIVNRSSEISDLIKKILGRF